MIAFWSWGSLSCQSASEDEELLLLWDISELFIEGVMVVEVAASNDDWSQEDDRDGDKHSSVVSSNSFVLDVGDQAAATWPAWRRK